MNEKGDVEASMEEFMDTISPMDIPRARRKQNADSATNEEIIGFLSDTGKLNFLGHSVLPVTAYVASHYQQRIGRVTVADMRELNSALKEVQKLQPCLLYLAPPSDLKKIPCLLRCLSGQYSYGQTGYISGVLLETQSSLLYKVLDWHSSKQSRISFLPLAERFCCRRFCGSWPSS